MFQDNQPQQPEQPQVPEQSPQSPQSPQPPQAPVQQPTPVQQPEQTTQEERMWAVISYIAFLGVVTLAINPRSAFCKHHAANGLAIFLFWFVGLILFAMPSFIGAIGGLVLLGSTVLAVFGILKSIQSYKLELPVLSSIAKAIPTDSLVGSLTGKTPDTTQTTEQPAQPTEQPQEPIDKDETTVNQ